MFLTFNWRIIQWVLVVLIGFVPLILKLAGILDWLPWWYFVVPLVIAAPQLIIIAISALVGWIALHPARGSSTSSSSRRSDR